MSKVSVSELKDLEDGGALLSMEMDNATLKTFAAIGLLKVLTDTADKIIEENENAQAE